MNPIDLVGNAISLMSDKPEMKEYTRDGLCAITGVFGKCISRKAVVPDSNTDSEIFAAPDSELASVNAFYCFKYRPERASLWISTEKEFRKLDRVGAREIIISSNYPKEPWCMYITTSYKKHGSLYCQVNSGNKAIIRFEMLNVDCSDRKYLLEIWDRLNSELRNGTSRKILESLEPPLNYQFDLARWIKFEQWARPLYKSGLYQLMCYLLPSQKELKEEEKSKNRPK